MERKNNNKNGYIRPTWDEHWLEIASVVSKRGTCLRRRFGAVIVKNNVLLATGYNGAPRSTPNCLDIGKCYREENNIPVGTQYEKCRALHAEANTIINAAREGIAIKNTILYLYGENYDHSEIKNIKPCKMCRGMIINSGIEKVITTVKEKMIVFDVMRWVIDANADPYKELNEDGY